ncbi:MAG: nucleoside transporter C-terminal domain-containing protein [Thermoanaerobaculia bacterium]|nr:nucleoside transporter C-terminal domain-containing protein [Thermoanaerobaculia bacterium]
MSWISLLGLLALLGIAWALSYHKTRIPWPTVFWGLGLQFLFALIILREDWLSYLGMGIFALLLIVYIRARAGDAPVAIGIWVGGSALLAGFGVWLLPGILSWALVALLALLLVQARWSLHPRIGSVGAVVLVALGFAFLVSRGITGQAVFSSFSDKVAEFLSLSDYGAEFLFGNLADPQYFFPGEEAAWPGFGFLFAFKVLPTIIFFAAFMAVLYYLGIVQKVIEAMSRFMRWTIRTSGAETLSCSANIFVGQTEAPLLIKPFLPGMTRSELLTIMVGGFATIAGGVLAGYIAFGVPAGHLVAASVMSAPAALVLGKLIYPETEHSETAGDVEIPEIESGDNLIEAASIGVTDGLKLAVNVGAMLIGFIALIAVVDVALNWMDSIVDGRWLGGEHYTYQAVGLTPATGEFAGFFPGSLQTLFGTILSPLAFLMGVPWEDADLVGNLLGIKLSLNEFVAYGTLGTYIERGALSPRAITISTYALCGFANFASIGIQIGGISALAPTRKSELAALGLKAMFGGALASWTTATIAGILV